MTGKRCRFRRNPLHQATVSANGVDVVVEDFEAGFIEAAGEPLLGDGHSDARCNALTQWACRRLDARDPVVLGVTRRLAVELSETPDVVERYGRFSQPFIFGINSAGASEMKCRPQQHRSMAVRKYEAITIGPDRIVRIKAQDPIPDRIDQWRQCHRRAWVSGLGLLHGVDRKRANGVDAKLIE